MGDDAEYYIEQQQEEARFQQNIKDELERQMTRDRILRENKIKSNQKKPSEKD